MADTVSMPTIDLLDPATFAHGQPHEHFRRLRDHDPVHHHPEPDGPGFWAVTRHADVRAVGRDAATFSSEPTIMIPDGEIADIAGHKMMLMMDPPDHSRYRRLVNRGFTPRGAAELRPRVEQLARRIVDAVAPKGECDLVEDVAGELPSFVVADLLGLPLDDGRRLYQLTETIHSAPGAVPEGAQAAAIGEMFAYATQVIADKRANPGDDLSSQLLAAEIDGHRLDEIDFCLFFMLLVDAGGDTTRNLVAGGMAALFDHPDERARLEADLDGLLPSAIEEMLRWVSPVIYMRRRATKDTELGGRAIAEGDKVVMYYGSANRDERVFADPDRFDIGRTPNDHVAFGGGGPHFCLGSHLARIEIDAMFRELLTRLPDLAPAGPVEYQPSTFISGPRHLPVRFTPER
ncbi:MAG: cytochrome P450 [Actinomycetota bacterium]|nr:cytochrome P450 [Actinomycetota bacterium]